MSSYITHNLEKSNLELGFTFLTPTLHRQK